MAIRVTFHQDWTYHGAEKFRFMIDYKAGSTVLVPNKHAEEAVEAGVAEYVEISEPRQAVEEAGSVATSSEAGDQQVSGKKRKRVGGASKKSGS